MTVTALLATLALLQVLQVKSPGWVTIAWPVLATATPQAVHAGLPPLAISTATIQP